MKCWFVGDVHTKLLSTYTTHQHGDGLSTHSPILHALNGHIFLFFFSRPPVFEPPSIGLLSQGIRTSPHTPVDRKTGNIIQAVGDIESNLILNSAGECACHRCRTTASVRGCVRERVLCSSGNAIVALGIDNLSPPSNPW